MPGIAFLLDVDNTLIDNDRVKSDLDGRLRHLLGASGTAEFWAVYEEVRSNEEVVDFPATLSRFRRIRPDLPETEVSELVNSIDFASYLYPGALDAVAYLNDLGQAVIVSDGDPVFQMKKIEQSGLGRAVGGRVILTTHKQDELQVVFDRFPAGHYAAIDDKTSILADIGRLYPDVTTVLVCQGKYARLVASPPPDMVVPHIGDLVHVPEADFRRTEPVPTSSSSR